MREEHMLQLSHLTIPSQLVCSLCPQALKTMDDGTREEVVRLIKDSIQDLVPSIVSQALEKTIEKTKGGKRTADGASTSKTVSTRATKTT